MMARMICLVIGYLCGLLQTGFIYGELHGMDIRKYGSGNSGTTNALRVMGKKAGLIVFIGDAFKALIPCTILRFVLGGTEYAGMLYLLMLYLGFGVILGHNFPFYMQFKGGKGIAATAGVIASLDWRLTLICAVIFLATVILTRYVSLGSILVVIAFFVVNVYLSWAGYYGLDEQYLTAFWVLCAVVSLLVVWRHRANIKRLLSGTENKLWGKKE